jgi:prepilin signal peptidase PulO-like enzyme (type II secretory pathway)
MLITIYCAILGLLIGSAINAIVWRLYVNRSWVHGRSMCPDCEHTLAAKDLVPLFSWLALHGKCRYCKKAIHWQYPVVEALTAVLFTWSAVILAPDSLEVGIKLGVWLVLLTMLMILAVYDIRWMILPNKIIFPAIGVSAVGAVVSVVAAGAAGSSSQLPIIVGFLGSVGLIVLLLQKYWPEDKEWLFLGGFIVLTAAVSQLRDYVNFPQLSGPLLAAVGGTAVFLAIAKAGSLLSKQEAMGGGDIKLVFLMGLTLGVKGLALALLMAFNSAALVGVVLILLRRKWRGVYIPFGPFLIASTVIVFLYGHEIIHWYLRLNGLE